MQADDNNLPLRKVGIINREADVLRNWGRWVRWDPNPKLNAVQHLTDVNPQKLGLRP
jgi:hypothetical protein